MTFHDRLLQTLRYEPSTGKWFWLKTVSSRAIAGRRAGHIKGIASNRRPRRWYLRFEGKAYRSSRLAWFYMNKTWPTDQIDHKDGDHLNDRWSNLRQATQSENCANKSCYRSNKFGLKGVHRRENGTYRSMIQVDGKRISIGTFKTPRAAFRAYKSRAKEIFGEFARVA